MWSTPLFRTTDPVNVNVHIVSNKITLLLQRGSKTTPLKLTEF